MDLVAKKNSKSLDSNGYHAGLLDAESAELLKLEDLLPIEALMAFHLLALRRVYDSQIARNGSSGEKSIPRGRSKNRFFIRRSSSANRKKAMSRERPEKGTVPIPPQLALSQSNNITNPLSLFDAMTLRLGKKTWFVDWRLHDASLSVILRRTQADFPVALLDLRASGSARSFGRGKRDFFFDIIRCDLHHRNEKVLFVSPPDDNLFDEETLPGAELYSLFPWTPSCKAGTKDAGPDIVTPAKFLELPPSRTICRVSAAKSMDSFKLSLSAHPVTLVWTTSLFDGLSEFLAQPATVSRADITEDIKNAATPVARKAQLALLSPASSALHLNIAAPKIWIPIVSRDSESVLFVDAGAIKLSTQKEEGQTDSDWDMKAKDIQVNFVRNFNASRLYSDIVNVEPTAASGTPVIRPFSVHARNEIRTDSIANPDSRDVSFAAPFRNKEVVISPICLSLVDAELLARSFGKWYARVIRRAATSEKVEAREAHDVRVQRSKKLEVAEVESIRRPHLPGVVTVKMDKIEVAVEGHSKHTQLSYDEKSLASLDSHSQLTSSPSTRTYLVELFCVLLKHSRVEHAETTNLSVADASIVRLRDGSLYTPFSAKRENVESENCILSCGDSRDVQYGFSTECQGLSVLRASLLRDKGAHLDEVELDIKSPMLRVSPTTLKDCAKAFRRIVEVVQIMTREMERKVHEAGREARRRDRVGEFRDNSFVVILPQMY